MKKTVKTSRTAGALERMYRILNREKFKNKLPVPIITIQSSPNAWGHCTRSKLWKAGENEHYELNISAELLNAPIEEILDTMIHEMIHLYCRENDIKEVSRGGAYHNKKFKELAEEKGLVTVKCSSGYNTKGEGNEHLIQFALDHEIYEIEMHRENPRINIAGIVNGMIGGGNTTTGTTTTATNTSHSRKYQCPKCKTSVRATKDVNIGCMDCGVKMEKAN